MSAVTFCSSSVYHRFFSAIFRITRFALNEMFPVKFLNFCLILFLKKTQSCTKWVYYTLKKYIKFWSISLEHFVERKPPISEECCSLYLRFFRASFFKKGFLKTRYLDQLRGKINFLNRNLKCSGSLENCELIHYIHSCSWS